MASRLLIVSLKYSPGLWKEFSLIGTLAAERGCDVTYFLAPEYQKVGNALPRQLLGGHSQRKIDIAVETLRAGLMPSSLPRIAEMEPTIVFFYNFHPINLLLVDRLRRTTPNADIVVFVHDPQRDKSAFRVSDRVYYAVAEVMEGVTIRRADRVIVASDYGRHLLEQRFGRISGMCHVARLLVPDTGEAVTYEREFVTMLGHCNSATGHEAFFNLLNHVTHIESDRRFALVTSSDIGRFVAALSHHARARLLVINRAVISDEEINQILRRSYAVLRFDRQLAQSGVIPVAFMNGTSVIGRDIPGLRQDIDPGETGLLLPPNFDNDHVLRAIDEIVKDFPRYSRAARRAYESRWSAKNFARYYPWLHGSGCSPGGNLRLS